MSWRFNWRGSSPASTEACTTLSAAAASRSPSAAAIASTRSLRPEPNAVRTSVTSIGCSPFPASQRQLLQQSERVTQAAGRVTSDQQERVLADLEPFLVRDHAQPAGHVVGTVAAELKALAA